MTKAAGLDAGADARPTTRKIAAASSQEVADLLADAEAVMEVLNLKLADHSRHQEMIRTVQWALIQKKQVTGQYVKPVPGEAGQADPASLPPVLRRPGMVLIARSNGGKLPEDVQDCPLPILADD